jgi:hypothetical protein
MCILYMLILEVMNYLCAYFTCLFWKFFIISANIFKGLLGHKNPIPTDISCFSLKEAVKALKPAERLNLRINMSFTCSSVTA